MNVLKGEEDWRTNRVVLSKICSHLDVGDLLQTALVSRNWNDATKPVLYQKAVVKVNRAAPLIQELKWVGVSDHSIYEYGITKFNRFAEFVGSLKEYRFEGLELSWCPLMKNHTVWAKVAPQVKTLIVCKLHNERCTSCEDSTGFLKSVLAVFGNVTSLTAGDHLPYRMFENPRFEDRTNSFSPIDTGFEQLKSLLISADFANVDASFIASLIPQLECFDICSLSPNNTWPNFVEFMETITTAHPKVDINIKQYGIKCNLSKQELETVEDSWFTMISRPEKVQFWYSIPRTWNGGFKAILSLQYSVFNYPSKELWIVLDLLERWREDPVEIVQHFLSDLAWSEVPSYRVTLGSFAQCASSQVVEDTAIWKRTVPQTGLTSLLVYSNQDLGDFRHLMKVLPTASYLVISRAGQVVAEFIGTSQLLFRNTAEIIKSDFISSRRNAKNQHFLINMPAFRQHVGIPENWYPTEFTEEDTNCFVLVYFAVAFKRLNEVRVDLSRYVYPATKLNNTYQILQCFQEYHDERVKKTILNWTDPICLRLAAGDSVVGGSDYIVFRT